MTFADLVTGDTVFVDANTLIHLFQPHPQLGPFCHQLIQRIDNQDLVGFTSEPKCKRLRGKVRRGEQL